MKNLYNLILLLLLISCNQNPVEKPEKVIDKEIMTKILYDIEFLKAAKGYGNNRLNDFDTYEYIYQKYNIDSLILAQNQKYYASRPKELKKMYENVSERIKKDEKELDSIGEIEKSLKIKKVNELNGVLEKD